MMEDIHFDRICRTTRSEAYLISQGEEPIARIDLHFTHTVVYGVLIVEKELEEQQITELIGRVDDDLVWTADLPRDDFVVSVYQGRELGMYSDPDLQEEEEASEEGELSRLD
jgi:hypothetical protein